MAVPSMRNFPRHRHRRRRKSRAASLQPGCTGRRISWLRARPWLTVVAAPTPGGLLETRYGRTWIVLVAGLMLTAGLAIYLWRVAHHTLNLSEANKTISELAETDALTTLSNRRVFTERLEAAFAASKRGSAGFAVLYFDLDHFKDVNDTLGHLLGDALLQAVADRVKGVLRNDDFVARFGGDEFAVLQRNVSDVATAERLARRICSTVAAPYRIDGNEIHISASIGISPYAPNIASPEVMMIQADLALYRAKEHGRNCLRFHSADLDREVEERVIITEDLRGAIDRGEIELHFQPQVALATGKIVGMEALMRWNHPSRGLIPPSIFIPIAERTGLVMLLGRWALDEACRQMKEWIAQGIGPKLIAVNVSALQFRVSSDLERNIADSLSRHGIAPELLELELTESVLMEAAQQHSDCFDRLRRLGVRIAIDDFGTGYSSLHYLTTYRVNQVKIAQELVSKVDSDSRNATVVRAAVRLARDLDIGCIAEGVEFESTSRISVVGRVRLCAGLLFQPAGQCQTSGRIAPPGRSRTGIRSFARCRHHGCLAVPDCFHAKGLWRKPRPPTNISAGRPARTDPAGVLRPLPGPATQPHQAAGNKPA